MTVAPLSPRQPRFPSLLRLRTCRFGDGLERRAWTPPEGFKFSDVTALTQQGTGTRRISVAVSPDGLPLHFFPQHSSGDENLDRAALRYLAGCRFAPAPAELNRPGAQPVSLGRRYRRGYSAMIRVELAELVCIYVVVFLPQFWLFG